MSEIPERAGLFYRNIEAYATGVGMNHEMDSRHEADVKALVAAERNNTAVLPYRPPSRRALSMAEIEACAKSAFESGSYNLPTVAQGVIRIQAGLDMGLTVTESLRNVFMVGAMPSFSANFIAARIKASRPRYNYRPRDIEKWAEVCTLEFYEDGEPVGLWTWSRDDSKKAGFLDGKNSHSYKKFERSMNFCRCVSSGAKVFTPDLFGSGVTIYTPDELGGEVAAEDIREAEFTVK